MKLQVIVALIAIVSMAGQANAQTEQTASPNNATQSPVIVINNESSAKANSNAANETTSKATQVKADSTVESSETFDLKNDSRINNIRRTRQDAELQTSETVEAKIEQSRLKDEELRVKRLFGDRPDAPASEGTSSGAIAPRNSEREQNTPIIIVTPVMNNSSTSTPAQAPVAAPVEQPSVTLIQAPAAAPVAAPAPAPAPAKVEQVESVRTLPPVAPVSEEEKKEEKSQRKFYVGGILAAPEYNATNVKTNYGLGVSVGTMLDEHQAVELSFLYSNYYVDTFWRYGLYSELTQYDLQAAYKYYLLTGPIKPYIGASISYINRSYTDRVQDGLYYQYNRNTDSQSTNAVDVGALAGVDFSVNQNFMLGIGVDYNHNVMNSANDFQSIYNLQPGDTKPLEEIDYYTVKITAKILF